MTGPVEAVVHLIQGLTWLAQHLGWWLVVAIAFIPVAKRIVWAWLLAPAYQFGKRMGVRSTAPGTIWIGVFRLFTGRKAP